MFLHPYPYNTDTEIHFPIPTKEYSKKKEPPITAPRVMDYPVAPHKQETKLKRVQEIPQLFETHRLGLSQ